MLKQSTGLLLLICLLAPATPGSRAQTVTPVPHLDIDRFVGAWYEIARYPTKREKRCVENVFELIARGERSKQLLVVNSCGVGGGFLDIRNGTIKAQGRSGDGRLKLSYLWPFSTPYWVLAQGPEERWSLVGSPNRKNLWILSRTPVLQPEVLAEIKAKAAAEGFSTDKLVITPQTATVIHSKSLP